MRWRLSVRALAVLSVAGLALGAGAAFAVPTVQLTADIDEDSITCTDGLHVEADVSVPAGSGAYLQYASISVGEVADISGGFAPYDQTWATQHWSSQGSWGRRDALTSWTGTVDTASTWDYHSWAGDASGDPVGTPNGWWEVYVFGSTFYRGQWLGESDVAFVDCSDPQNPVITGPGSFFRWCFETSTQPASCES